MTQFDYETLRNQFKTDIEDKFGGTILNDSTTMKLIDAFAERLAEMGQYAEYLTRESKWSLAQNVSSIMSQATLFSYVPHRLVGASGPLTVSVSKEFSAPPVNPVTIPKFTRFSNGSNTYCADAEYVISPSDSIKTINVVQGEPKSVTFNNQSNSVATDGVYTLYADGIENNLFELKVNNIIAKRVDYFGQSSVAVNSDPDITYHEYMVLNTPRFNGIKIIISPTDRIVAQNVYTFTYLETLGMEGSVVTTNTITKVLDSVQDSTGTIVKIYCKNDGAISGGDGIEDIESIRTNAPKAFSGLDRLITRNDYEAAIRNIITNSIIKIWTEHDEAGTDNQTQDAYNFINNSKIFVSGVQYQESTRIATSVVSPANKEKLNHLIEEKGGLTDYFILKEPDIYRVYLYGTAYYDYSSISKADFETELKNAISNYFSKDKIKFGKSYYLSKILSLFSTIETSIREDIHAALYSNVPYDSSHVTSRKNNFTFHATSDVFQFVLMENHTGTSYYDVKEQLFTLEKHSGTWGFYINGTATQDIAFKAGEPDPDSGTLGQIEINNATITGKLDASGVSLSVLFEPMNDNPVINSESQIVTLTEAYDTLAPWKNQTTASYNLVVEGVDR